MTTEEIRSKLILALETFSAALDENNLGCPDCKSFHFECGSCALPVTASDLLDEKVRTKMDQARAIITNEVLPMVADLGALVQRQSEAMFSLTVLAEKYEIRESTSQDGVGIYLRHYNVRVATFCENTKSAQEMFAQVLRRPEP